MTGNYSDIISKIPEEPQWWDSNGTPRYAPFTPELCTNIYARRVVLLRISCQSCGREFSVEMNSGPWSEREPPKCWHYGDPPYHSEDPSGSTMNCNDLWVVEVWERDGAKWVRRHDMEGVIR